MAEEHRCQAPEGHRLCANNCGFFGSPATMNLCSKCFRDFRLKEQQEASTKSTIESALASASACPPPPPAEAEAEAEAAAVESLPPPPPPPAMALPEVAAEAPIVPDATAAQPNRCAMCRKRVGLTGFKCRCGITCCGVHRYPEKHDCSFDFKKIGREEIVRANPVIKAEKLQKI